MIRREVRRLFAPKGGKREDWPLPLCAGAALFNLLLLFLNFNFRKDDGEECGDGDVVCNGDCSHYTLH